MSLWLLIKLFFLFLYIGLSALITYLIYNEEKMYYNPLFVRKKSKKEGEAEETVSVHDEFDEFAKRDEPINIIKLFIGILTLFWIRIILDLGIALFHANSLLNYSKKRNFVLKKEERDYIVSITNFRTKFFLFFAGLFVDFKRLPDEEVLKVYRKYFGPDYQLDYDGKFCCYISNHTSMYDMALAMAYLGCGFVAKEAVKKIPIFGTMMVGLHTILVDRGNTTGKKDVLELIEERQKEYYEGKPVMPFLIFPEGTTTSARHLITFKKGAFVTSLPIKPTIIHPNLKKHYHIGVGASDATLNYFRSLTEIYNKVEYIELPIMTPNEYMYSNFSNYGKEKWEIYAEVAREIMCTLGNLKKSDMGIRDSFRYISCLEEKKLLDRDTYKIKSD